MTKRGTVILSSIRQLLGRSHHVRQFERSGLRLTPVTTSFVTLHRNFASSTNSSNDEQKKLEKHKKETSSSNVENQNQKQNQNQNENKPEIKVVWEYSQSQKLKDCKNLECKHRPGDDLAIRAENFTKNQRHKIMMDNYEAYKKALELEEVRAKLEREVQATDVKVALEKKMNPLQKWKAKKRSDDDAEDLRRLNLSDLRARLRQRGLSATGRKQTLIERLETTATTATTTATETTATPVTSNNLSPSCHGEETKQQQQQQQQQKQQQLANSVANVAQPDACGNNNNNNSSNNNSNKKAATLTPENDDVCLEYVNGMPHLTIRLPSRNELCQFALKPISHTVGHLLTMLREEDRGIDRAAIINKHGVRIASSCTIDRLLDDTFSIEINNRILAVHPPEREKLTVETVDKMGDVRKIIGQLYEAFNVGEYQLAKSHQLAQELESLRYELEPLEQKKQELAKKAERRTNMMTWMGLGLMSVQFGILARLTWWEYSWDIMEPVTYFVTYGTTMAMYAYYCVTKREYILENVYNREYTLNIYRNAKKNEFDVETYNRLKRKTAELEYNLRRLNDPINMQLPAHLVRTQLDTPPTDESGSSSSEQSKEKCT